MAVASAGPYANHLHLAADRQPCQYLATQFSQSGWPSCRPTVSKYYNSNWMIKIQELCSFICIALECNYEFNHALLLHTRVILVDVSDACKNVSGC